MISMSLGVHSRFHSQQQEPAGKRTGEKWSAGIVCACQFEQAFSFCLIK